MTTKVRKNLKDRRGKRYCYIAVFEKFGEGNDPPTALFTSVKDYETEELLADHCWISRRNNINEIRSCHPRHGDKIVFNASVRKYNRGTAGPDGYTKTSHDYCLDKVVVKEKIKKQCQS